MHLPSIAFFTASFQIAGVRCPSSRPPPWIPLLAPRPWRPVPGVVWVCSHLGGNGGRGDHAQGKPRQRAPHHTRPGGRPCGSSESPPLHQFHSPFRWLEVIAWSTAGSPLFPPCSDWAAAGRLSGRQGVSVGLWLNLGPRRLAV